MFLFDQFYFPIHHNQPEHCSLPYWGRCWSLWVKEISHHNYTNL